MITHYNSECYHQNNDTCNTFELRLSLLNDYTTMQHISNSVNRYTCYTNLMSLNLTDSAFSSWIWALVISLFNVSVFRVIQHTHNSMLRIQKVLCFYILNEGNDIKIIDFMNGAMLTGEAFVF